MAQALHAVSPRAQRPMVTMNAGGLSEGVFESELFGHVKGAFTDAKADRVGRFELADERHAVPGRDRQRPAQPAGQAAARARDRRVRARGLVADPQGRRADPLGHQRRRRRGGGGRALPAGPAVPAEHGRDPAARRCASGARTSRRWRSTSSASTRSATARASAGFDSAAMQPLLEHPWPGNVRELDHAIERAVLMARGDLVQASRPRPAADPRGRRAPRGHEPRRRRALPHQEGHDPLRRQRQPGGQGARPQPQRPLPAPPALRPLGRDSGERPRQP